MLIQRLVQRGCWLRPTFFGVFFLYRSFAPSVSPSRPHSLYLMRLVYHPRRRRSSLACAGQMRIALKCLRRENSLCVPRIHAITSHSHSHQSPHIHKHRFDHTPSAPPAPPHPLPTPSPQPVLPSSSVVADARRQGWRSKEYLSSSICII
jgi:hypothetical protein